MAVEVASGEIDRLYRRLREMAIRFEIAPGERINEGQLAKRLSTSRTPLREAMNRLVSEGLLTVTHNRGFFCRQLDPKTIFDLYELRCGLEMHSVKLACQRASDKALLDLQAFLIATADEPDDREEERVLHFDERFHETIAELSENASLLAALRNLNARIYFVRWIDMRGRRAITQSEHMEILNAMERRDSAACVALMERHITRRMSRIVEVVREGFSTIYMREHLPILNGAEAGE